jgi:hypothetical protein
MSMIPLDETIVAGMRAISAVDSRAHRCRKPLCRRHRVCMANPYLNGGTRTGGCPLTTPAEWRAIDLAITTKVRRVFAAVEAVRAETGESFEAACKRLIVQMPNSRWDRRNMIGGMMRKG